MTKISLFQTPYSDFQRWCAPHDGFKAREGFGAELDGLQAGNILVTSMGSLHRGHEASHPAAAVSCTQYAQNAWPHANSLAKVASSPTRHTAQSKPANEKYTVNRRNDKSFEYLSHDKVEVTSEKKLVDSTSIRRLFGESRVDSTSNRHRSDHIFSRGKR